MSLADRSRWPMTTEEEEEEERQNFIAIVTAFKQYKLFSSARVHKTESYLNTLKKEHQTMLLRYRNHLTKVRDCISTNDRVLQEMIKNVDHLFPNENKTSSDISNETNGHHVRKLKVQDLEKVQTMLKHVARDWSTVGELERKQCYGPIIEEIQKYYNEKDHDLSQIKVLVPGSGLARLSYDLACLGFYCEGNEVSLFMLIASNFVLNKCESKDQYTIYPWVHQYVNNLNREDQVAPVTFPDISPKSCGIKGQLYVSAGNFTQVYPDDNDWDCVVTCFFIDCANNVIEFIETIYRILKPNGIWINLGPLLYHFADINDENSIEPTFEDLLPIMRNIGFEIVKYETGVRTSYAQNPKSMLKQAYESIFWVCRKPLVNAENSM
ncbi:carnosine N-methyltransferase isoform X2 [Condylostylus longicornis]|uniref:carnosine N-methyltransferase isoform X2 n=1 Tax=Condylostylus longicornis TaxID=2530218 RepID=UPI00244DAC22|nr:carnosine N-methyltransferase isoform X2 [Condylostylus longicornis]